MVEEERKDKGPKEEEWELLGRNSERYGDGEEEKKKKGREKKRRAEAKREEEKWCSEARGTRIYQEGINFSWRNL